jgi:hypothetical protein
MGIRIDSIFSTPKKKGIARLHFGHIRVVGRSLLFNYNQ